MSPVIYREEPQGPKHSCNLPTTYGRGGWGEVSRHAPDEPVGTIWECDVCEKHYVSCRETFLYHLRWKRIRPWHYRWQKKIKESLEADNLN